MYADYMTDLLGYSRHADFLRDAGHDGLVARAEARVRLPRGDRTQAAPRGRLCLSLAGQQYCLLR